MMWQILVASLWLGISGLNLWASWLVLKQFRKVQPRRAKAEGITVIKPLKGLDESLSKNLESIFQQNYPHFEVLFSVADPADPARKVVRDLMVRYPHVDAKVFIGDLPVGANPKVNNMVKPYEYATYDIIVVNDSNVCVDPDYLSRLVSYLDDDVGVVSSLVSGVEAQSLGARLEASQLHGFVARGMMLARMLGHHLVIGKSMMFRKSVADRFGGMRGLGQYLAEDHAISVAMRGLGLNIIVTAEPIRQILGSLTLKQFWMRHLRWGRMRKATNILGFVLELVCHPLMLSTLGAVAVGSFDPSYVVSFFLMQMGLWFAIEAVLHSRMSGRVELSFPFIWLVKDFLNVLLWIHICSGQSVDWRGQKLRLKRGGLVDQPTGSSAVVA